MVGEIASSGKGKGKGLAYEEEDPKGLVPSSSVSHGKGKPISGAYKPFTAPSSVSHGKGKPISGAYKPFTAPSSHPQISAPVMASDEASDYEESDSVAPSSDKGLTSDEEDPKGLVPDMPKLLGKTKWSKAEEGAMLKGVKLFKFKCRTQTAIFKQIKKDENLGPVLANRTVKALIDKYGKWVKDGSQPSLTKGGCPVVEKTGGAEEDSRQKTVGAEEDSRQKTVGAEEERGVAGIATALDDLIDCLGETTEKLKKIREKLPKKM